MKLLFWLATIVLIATCDITAQSPTDLMSVNESLRELKELHMGEIESLYVEKKKLQDEYDQLSVAFNRLYFDHHGFAPKSFSSGTNSAPNSSDDPNSTLLPYPGTSQPGRVIPHDVEPRVLADDYAALQKQNGQLQSNIRELLKQIDDQTATQQLELAEYETNLSAAARENSDLEARYLSITIELKEALAELSISADLIECVRTFYKENQRTREAAQGELREARAKFDRYQSIKGRGQARYRKEITEILNFIHETYRKYDDRPTTRNCGGGIESKDVIDFMNASDHLNLATILAADPQHLINKYPGGTDQRTVAMNADMIYHLSQVYAKQNSYGELAGAKSLAADLTELMQFVPGALSTSAALDARDSTAHKAAYFYGSVATEYKKKKYSKAFGVYSQFKRVEGEQSLANNHEVRAATMTTVGIILLFDLGQVSRAIDIPLLGTYSGESLKNQQKSGVALLNEVMTFRRPDGKFYDRKSPVYAWQRRAATALSKHYFPSSQEDRRRRRDEIRMARGKKLKRPTNKQQFVGGTIPQSRARRLTVAPSLYPIVPIRRHFVRSDGEVSINVEGSGIEGGVRIENYKPASSVHYGIDLGYADQFLKLDHASGDLMPSTLDQQTIFGGPFISISGGGIERKNHPTLSLGASYRYDIKQRIRYNLLEPDGSPGKKLLNGVPFLKPGSWYLNLGLGFKQERLVVNKGRMLAGAFRLFAFLPLFDQANQVSSMADDFTSEYSRRFEGLERRTIHAGFTYSKLFEVHRNGIRMTADQMEFINRKSKVRVLQPLVNTNPPTKRIDGRISLMVSSQPDLDSLYIFSSDEYGDLQKTIGVRLAYTLHFLGNNRGYFNQSTEFAYEPAFNLFNFFATAGLHQQTYRLSTKDSYASFRSIHGFAEGGFRYGMDKVLLLAGGGINFQLMNEAIYEPGNGVIGDIYRFQGFAGIQLANGILLRVSTGLLNTVQNESGINFDSLLLQAGFGF